MVQGVTMASLHSEPSEEEEIVNASLRSFNPDGRIFERDPRSDMNTVGEPPLVDNDDDGVLLSDDDMEESLELLSTSPDNVTGKRSREDLLMSSPNRTRTGEELFRLRVLVDEIGRDTDDVVNGEREDIQSLAWLVTQETLQSNAPVDDFTFDGVSLDHDPFSDDMMIVPEPTKETESYLEVESLPKGKKQNRTVSKTMLKRPNYILAEMARVKGPEPHTGLERQCMAMDTAARSSGLIGGGSDKTALHRGKG